MIRKFAFVRSTVFLAALVILVQVPGIFAQTTQQSTQQPAAQPSDQQSGSQEASAEETTRRPKLKVRDYKTWNFNLGGGANLPSGTTNTYVRGGGGVAAAGVARNFGKYFGLRFDFQWDNLPLRSSALELSQARSATSHVYSFNFDPIINIPVSPNWGGYIVFGPAYFRRSGKLDNSTAIPGSPCNGFFTWWGTCYAGSLPVNGQFQSSSQNEFGENFGGGITRKIRPSMDFYAEVRYFHGKHGGTSTDLRPITIGIRW